MQTLFDSLRLVSREYNRRVHALFTSPAYITYILKRYDPCFKLQLSYPDGPSRPDLFMDASLVLPWREPRNLEAVRMRMTGKFGGSEDRVMIWVDGNYKPITSLAVTWVDDESSTERMDVIPTLSSISSISSVVTQQGDVTPRPDEDVVSTPEEATTTLAGSAQDTEIRDTAEERQDMIAQDIPRTGWYEGVVDWWSIFKNMARARARAPGDYGTWPISVHDGKSVGSESSAFLSFTRLSGFEAQATGSQQALMGHELERSARAGGSIP